jgi:hypothetical protein
MRLRVRIESLVMTRLTLIFIHIVDIQMEPRFLT